MEITHTTILVSSHIYCKHAYREKKFSIEELDIMLLFYHNQVLKAKVLEILKTKKGAMKRKLDMSMMEKMMTMIWRMNRKEQYQEVQKSLGR